MNWCALVGAVFALWCVGALLGWAIAHVGADPEEWDE